MKNLLLSVLAFSGAYLLWNQNYEERLVESPQSSSPFVEVVMPSETASSMVYILAPINCPKKGRRRADRLEKELISRGIPVERRSRILIGPSNSSKYELERYMRSVAVLKGEVPAVFVNGRAKANPSVDEIVDEFRRNG